MCCGNEDVDMDDKVGQNKERKIRGTTEVREISKKNQESTMNWYGQ